MTLTDILVAVIVPVLTSTGIWGLLQLVLNRRGVKAEAAKQEAEAEKIREDAQRSETDRLALVAEVERKAYDSGREAADRRYRELREDYQECRSGLHNMRGALRDLLDAIAAIVSRAQPNADQDVTVSVTKDEMVTIRDAMRSAWDHLLN